MVKPHLEIFTGKTASQSINMHKDVVLVGNFKQFLSLNKRLTAFTYMLKSEDASHRNGQLQRLSSVTSYWRKVSRGQERRPHHLTKVNKTHKNQHDEGKDKKQPITRTASWERSVAGGLSSSGRTFYIFVFELFSDGERACGKVFGNNFSAILSPFWQSPLFIGALHRHN